MEKVCRWKSKGGAEMRMFSVMRRRDDLPEMTIPLVVLMTAGTLVLASAAGRLASEDLPGAAAALPLVAVATCLYALIILLWRKAASLCATPLTFAAMILSGSSLFAAVTITLSTLLMSYVFAVSLISREPKFKRIGSLTAAAAVCLALTAVAFAGFRAESYEAFVALCMDGLSALLGNAYGMPATESYVREAARGILVLAPALTVVLATAFAWFTELLAKSMFRLLACTDLFIGITHRITLPVPFAVIYASAFLLTMMTVPEQAPLLYTLLNRVMIAMMLPCTAVGISITLRKIRARMYYASRKRALTALLMVMAFAALGIVNAAMILSVAGAYFVIADFLKKRRKQRDRANREWQ